MTAGSAVRLLRRPVRSAVARTGGGDRGSAVVEFVSLGVLLLVPVVYLVLCLGQLQAAAFAAEGAARETARVMAAPDARGVARADAEAVVAIALSDQGIDPRRGLLVVRCSHDPCSAPEAQVQTTVTVEVVLPGVPGFLAAAVPASVPVVASGTATGDRFAGEA